MVRETKYIAPVTTSSYSGPVNWVWATSEITEENIALRKSLVQMSRKIAELEKRIPKENVIILRDLSREQAKNEIRELFKNGQTLYYSDIVRGLGIDLETVVEICDELRESGEIEVAEKM